jgi:hypothetical protein
VLLEFSEFIPPSAPQVYAYFQTPANWGRLYGFAGRVVDRGGGWYAVPLERFPFPLIARVTDTEPSRLVRWQLRGFCSGRGDVRLTDQRDGVQDNGYEEISVKLSGCGSRLKGSDSTLLGAAAGRSLCSIR